MDQNDHFIPEENNASTETEFQFNADYKTPKRKRKFLPLIIIGATLVLAFAVAAILFVPVLLGNPVENTVDALFFEVDAVEALMSGFEKSGVNVKMSGTIPKGVMEGLKNDLTLKVDGSAVGTDQNAVGSYTLTLGAGEEELACTVYYDDEIIAIKGLCEDEAKYVSLPRKGVSKALKESPLHPNSDTLLAMDEDAYDELVVYLESLDTEVTESDKDMEKAIDAITKEIKKQAETSTTFGFRKDGFGLYKKVKLQFNGKALDEIVGCVIDEAEDNERLDHMITFNGEVDEATGKAEKLTLSDWLKEHDDRLDSASLFVVYTVAGGKLDTVKIQASWENDLKKTDSFVLEMSFTYDNDDLGFDAKMIERSERNLVTLETSKMEYRKKIQTDKIKLSGCFTYESKLEKKDIVIEESKSELYLVYDKDDFEYRLEITDSESEETTEISGTFKVDAETIDFSITSIKGAIDIDEEILSLSFKAADEKLTISAPEHQALLEMNADDLKQFFWKLPVDRLDAVAEEWIGAPISSSLGIIVTTDDKILLQKEKVLEKTQECYDAFLDYIKTSDSDSIRVSVYIEQYEVHVLMRKSNSTLSVIFGYELTDDKRNFYSEATLENGKLVFKK